MPLISGLIINSHNRRNGVGRKLVDAAEKWAIKAGLSKIYVRSNINRDESHTFYKKMGFSHKKTAHHYEKYISIA